MSEAAVAAPTPVPATGAGAGAPPSPTSRSPALEGEALVEALRTQFEFYFSKQNLATDSFLLAQMNAHPNKSVPVDVLAGFRKIKSLTDSKPIILQALKQCKNLTLDEQAGTVRSALKTERTTLILRDMPPDANEAELRAVFESRPDSLCAGGKLISLTPDVNDTWFVQFADETTCMDVCMHIQEHAGTDKAYTYRGKPIKAGVKNESLQRSFYNGPSYTQAPGVAMPPMQAGMPPMMGPGGSSIMIGGPVGPNYGMHPAQAAGYYYPGPHGYPGYAPMQGYGMPTIPAPMPVPVGVGAGGAPMNPKAERKAAAAAAQAQVAAAAQAKKDSKKAAAAAGGATVAAGNATSPSADGTAAGAAGTAAAPKKKKSKAAKAADAAAAAAAASAAAPQQPVEDKSHLVGLYGHAPRLYSREQIAAVVESFIAAARANPTLMKRPESLNVCNDPDKVVLKQAPSTSFSILDPFPVIYPASPSPLLAAQPHHSSSLPFLELGSGALDAPYFAADQGFQAGQQGGNMTRRKSKSEAAGAKPKTAGATGAPAAAGGKPRTPASPSQKPRTPATATAAAPGKIVPPPAVQPASATAAGSILSTVAAGASTSSPAATTAAPSASPSKPTSFAAAALAAGNAPQTNAPKPAAAKPKPAVAPATTAAAPATGASTAGAGAKKDGKPKNKKPTGPATGAPATASPNAAAPTAAAPAKPAVPNYASRVGAISPAELAAKQAAQKQAKEAAERAAAAAAGKPTSPSTETAKPAATNGDKKPTAATAAASNPKSPASDDSSASSAKSPETPSKPAFSYAAMIKKAPAASPTPAANAQPRTVSLASAKDNNKDTSAKDATPKEETAKDVTSPSGNTTTATAPNAGSWRSQN